MTLDTTKTEAYPYSILISHIARDCKDNLSTFQTEAHPLLLLKTTAIYYDVAKLHRELLVRQNTIGCFFWTSFSSFHFVAQAGVLSANKGMFRAVIDMGMHIILRDALFIDQQLFDDNPKCENNVRYLSTFLRK